MECPTCSSTELQRNGYRNQVQCYKCKRCGRQFLASYKQMRYSEDIKQLCIQMYSKGLSTRTIEKMTEIHHTTILSWVRGVEGDALESPSASASDATGAANSAKKGKANRG